MDRFFSLIGRLQTLFALDLRSLACMRIGLGLLILVDLALRSRDLVAFYTDDGILPRELLTTGFNKTTQWSLHLVNGTPFFQATLFLVAAAFAVMLLVGYQTRIAVIVSWILLVSLHMRNPIILNAGDKYLALLTLWGIFLPLGEVWSIDARRRNWSQATTVVSLATVALYLQVTFVYVSTAVFKWREATWQRGDAIRLSLSKDYIVTSWGQKLLDYPELLEKLTLATVWLELLCPIALIVSRGWLRFGVVAGLVVFHVVLATLFTIGLFPYVCIVAFLAFLPAVFWSKALRLPQPAQQSYLEHRSRSTWLSWAETIVLSSVLLLSLWSCVEIVKPGWSMPQPLENVVRVFRLRQSWKMFTRLSETPDGWFVFHAQFADGTSEDLLTGSPISYKRPELASATFPNMRWRKLCTNIRSENIAIVADYLGEYLLLERDRRHHDVHKLLGLEISYLKPDPNAKPTDSLEVMGRQYATDGGIEQETLYEWQNEARKYQNAFITE